MRRRHFLTALLLGLPALPLAAQNLRTSRKKNTDPTATSQYIVSQAVRTAYREGWQRKPIGELMGHLGMLLVGTPYVGGTLEADGPETCRVDLTGLDCVTFFENVLGMARMMKLLPQAQADWKALVGQVAYTRYRGGERVAYDTRLHYTSEWILDNVAKSVVRDVTSDLDGVQMPLNVGFMSANPKYYKPLAGSDSLRNVIASIEQSINGRQLLYVPSADIEGIEERLQTGDIVAIATSKSGLDYAHTGMIVRVEGRPRFMHASLQKKKVIVDGALSAYVRSVRTHSGVTVVRPLEPLRK
jgi:hypothetical protein